MGSAHTQFANVVERLRQAYAASEATHDPPFRRAVREVLIVNASDSKCRRACNELQELGLLAAPTMAQASRADIVQALGDLTLAGAKAARLQMLARLLIDHYDGSLERLVEQGTESARRELMEIPGLGRATADAILFRAGELPVIPINAAIVRVAVRHGWVEPEADYDQVQSDLHAMIDADIRQSDDVAAWLSHVGRKYCRRSVDCDPCPLKAFLPAKGPNFADACGDF